ncbi:MAG: hypothetical protein LBC35_05465, partial [Coriobacteriales bacterium]|nr:hypothetical protein [Coriobacteriales bacterium]
SGDSADTPNNTSPLTGTNSALVSVSPLNQDDTSTTLNPVVVGVAFACMIAFGVVTCAYPLYRRRKVRNATDNSHSTKKG